MDYKKLVKKRKEAYTGDLVKEWLERAYDLGAKDAIEYFLPKKILSSGVQDKPGEGEKGCPFDEPVK
jgi:hypothetical protein